MTDHDPFGLVLLKEGSTFVAGERHKIDVLLVDEDSSFDQGNPFGERESLTQIAAVAESNPASFDELAGPTLRFDNSGPALNNFSDLSDVDGFITCVIFSGQLAEPIGIPQQVAAAGRHTVVVRRRIVAARR